MDTTDLQLKRYGLTGTETLLYQSGVGLDDVGVAQLHKLTGIKRPTIYHAMEQLAIKGIAILISTSPKRTYKFCTFEEMAGIVGEGRKSSALKQSQQTLNNSLTVESSSLPNSPQYRHFVGTTEVKNLLEVALHCESKRWDIISPRTNFLTSMGSAYKTYFAKSRQNQNIVARSIWEELDAPRRISQSTVNLRQPRILPRSTMKAISATYIIFDECVAIIRSNGLCEGELICSPSSYRMATELFESLWLTARPISST